VPGKSASLEARHVGSNCNVSESFLRFVRPWPPYALDTGEEIARAGAADRESTSMPFMTTDASTSKVTT
jgi:hypothetical protein